MTWENGPWPTSCSSAAARAATRVFARDGLASYLDREGVPYEPFTDFDELAAALS